jgi:hypothetical protein
MRDDIADECDRYGGNGRWNWVLRCLEWVSDEERSIVHSPLLVESALQYPQAKREQMSGTLAQKYQNTSVSRDCWCSERGDEVERRNIATEAVRKVNCTRRVVSELTTLSSPLISPMATTDGRSGGWARRLDRPASPDPKITFIAYVARSVHVTL